MSDIWAAINAITKVVDEQRREFADMLAARDATIAGLQSTIDQLSAALDGWRSNVAAFRGDAESQIAGVAQAVAGISDTQATMANVIETVTGRVEALETAPVVNVMAEARAVIDAQGTDLRAIVEAGAAAVNSRLDVVEARVTETRAIVEAGAAAVNSRLDAVERGHARVASDVIVYRAEAARDLATLAQAFQRQINDFQVDMRARVDDATASVDVRLRIADTLPRSFLIDRTGNLVSINNSGEATTLGPVCGRDGVDAAQIVNAANVGNCLHLHMSDGRILNAGELLTSQPEPVPEPGPEARVLSLHREGMSQRRIAKETGLDRRNVARIIRENADASKR